MPNKIEDAISLLKQRGRHDLADEVSHVLDQFHRVLGETRSDLIRARTEAISVPPEEKLLSMVQETCDAQYEVNKMLVLAWQAGLSIKIQAESQEVEGSLNPLQWVTLFFAQPIMPKEPEGGL